MDKKKPTNITPPEELKGFEEFIGNQNSKNSFLSRPQQSIKKETSFEHFTFLVNDAERLNRLKALLSEKMPFANKFEQGNAIMNKQREELERLRQVLFNAHDVANSPYRKSLSEIFDPFFGPTT